MSRSQRNESFRTLIVVILAAVFAGAAYGVHRAMQPPEITGFEEVGEPFYPDFMDPLSVEGLRVAAYDETTGKPAIFAIEREGDQWRIPSHAGYPAEAQERVAKAAVSVLGVKRQAVASRSAQDHARFGVVDPLDEEADATHGWGTRLTLFAEGEIPLADYIIGEAVPDTNQHFVRRPDEKTTYRAEISVDVSTKFDDWIEPDLLKVDANDVIGLKRTVLQVKTDTSRPGPPTQTIELEEVANLHRDEGNADWQLDGLDSETEQVAKQKADEAARAVDDLEILDVRPKPQGLLPNLHLDPEFAETPEIQVVLQSELESRGFILARKPQGDERTLLSREGGELEVSSSEGAVYHLHFGNRTSVRGQVEIGASAADDEKDAAGDGSANDESSADRSGRFLFVRVEFDPTLIGDEPIKPTPPEKPPALDENPADAPAEEESGNEEAGNEGSAEQEGPGDEESGAEDAEEKTGSIAPRAGGPPSPPAIPDVEETLVEDPETIRKKYAEAMSKYATDLADYDQNLETYEDKLAAGRKGVDSLNERFGKWYYVVSDDTYEKLKITRDQLVEPKSDDAPNMSTGAPPGGFPGSLPGGFPGIHP